MSEQSAQQQARENNRKHERKDRKPAAALRFLGIYAATPASVVVHARLVACAGPQHLGKRRNFLGMLLFEKRNGFF